MQHRMCKLMYKLAGVIVVLLANIQAGYAKTIKVQILTDDSYPPYSYTVGGLATGIYPEIVEAIDKKLPQFEILLRPVPWKRGLKLLESGRSFALMPPYYRPERTFISPYSLPILEEEVVAYCSDTVLNGHDRVRWPADFYGLTIGINSGFNIGGEEFWQAADEGKITIDESKTNHLNVLKLRNHRIDCYVNDKISIEQEIGYLIAEGTLEKSLDFRLAIHIAKESGYIAYTNVNEQSFPYKREFVSEFNQALQELQASGDIDRIIEAYSGK